MKKKVIGRSIVAWVCLLVVLDQGRVPACIPDPPPDPPQNLTATFVTGSNPLQINLQWSDVSTEDAYYVYRGSSSSGPWTYLGSRGANQTTYADTDNLQWGQRYYYCVQAVHNGQFSQSSNVAEALAWTGTLSDALDAPTLTWSTTGTNNKPWLAQPLVTHDGVDAAASGGITHNGSTTLSTTVAGPGAVSFWWKVSSESGYDYLRFYINTTLQNGAISGEVGWQQKSFQFSGGSVQLKWEYMKDGSASAGSDCGWVDQVYYLQAPANLSATALSCNQVNLTWSGGTAGAKRLKVERSLAGSGSYTAVVDVPVSATSYLDPSASGGTQYDYRIQSYSENGLIAYSPVATVSTPAGEDVTAPTNLMAVADDNTSPVSVMRVSWDDNSSNETEFVLERSLNGVSDWTSISVPAHPGLGRVNYLDGNLTEGTRYWYRVKARKNN